MGTSDSVKKNDGGLKKLRNDPNPLMESLRARILQRIEDINFAAENEIKKSDDDLRNEIENYRASHQKKYEEIIEYEESRMRNLLSIELKKKKLEIMESFISTVMDSAAVSLRDDQRYGDFLKCSVVSAFKDVIGSSATVLMSAEDMIFSDEIMKEIDRNGFNLRVIIRSDDRAGMGGAIVIDDETEVLYNNTVERMIYRKKGDIRREIVRGLKDFGNYKGD